jgi:hypothetical protein
MFPVLRNVFEKRPASFQSRLDEDAVLARLEAVVKRNEFVNFMNDCLVGKVSRSSLVIAHRRPGEQNPMRPTFFGVLRASDGGTVIEGYFAYSWIGRFFLLFGFAFLMLLALALALFAAGLSLSYQSFGSWPVSAIALLAAGLLFWLLIRASQPLREEDIEWISTRLCEELSTI